MRIQFFLIIFSIFSIACTAQEFTTFKNGMIYSESTMTKLGKIVDSLHLEYAACDLNKVFYTKQQSKGCIIRMNSGNIIQAKTDMENGISLQDFIVKYPDARVQKDALIIKSREKDYKGNEFTSYHEISVQDDYGLQVREKYKKSQYEKPANDTWIFSYEKKTSYYEESMDAFYFPENFKSIALDQKYSRQVIYADCLTDISTTKFLESTKKKGYADALAVLPENWRKLSVQEKEELLDSMRSAQAVGGCSQDMSPRIQAINMALLSAETGRWEIFLKSHLDMMNDRFERVSDGSYAWKDRKTYIRELEELDINVFDLLFGTFFRLGNGEKNHYYSSISRLGRAVSESKEKDKFMDRMIYLMVDEKLDDYNRLMAYFLYLNCNAYTKSETEKKINSNRLLQSSKKLPLYLAYQIDKEKKNQ